MTNLARCDYTKKLSKEERNWLFNANSGMARGSSLYLKRIVEDSVAERVARKETQSNNERRRDFFEKFSPVDTKFTVLLERAKENIMSNTLEDILIEVIDLKDRVASFRPYGGNRTLKEEDRIIVAIEGHYLQNRMGVVIGTRRDEFLVKVETKKGPVLAYFKSIELIGI